MNINVEYGGSKPEITIICPSVTKPPAYNIEVLRQDVAVELVLISDTDKKAEQFSQRESLVITTTEKLISSYAARNQLFSKVRSKWCLFLDDDVNILHFPEDRPGESVLWSPKVSVKGIPKTALERWYKYAAFKPATSLGKTQYAPTICWYFSTSSLPKNPFSEALPTAGDIFASRLFDSIEVRDDFVITTNLRNHKSIKRKFFRQAPGHVSVLKERYKGLYPLFSLAYILKNLVLGNNVVSLWSEEKLTWRQALYAGYAAGWMKAICFSQCFFLSRKRLREQASRYNAAEVMVDVD